MRLTLFTLAVAITFGTAVQAQQATAPSSRTRLTVERTVEEGVDLLLVTAVDGGGQPLEGVVIGAYVKRLFGELVIGRETTFDDGTAYIALPKDLPPSKSGRLSILVRVIQPQDRAGTQTQIEVAGVPLAGADEPPFPHRALWASHSPFLLTTTVTVLLGGVWLTYAFVLYQVRCIRKGI